VYPLGSLKPPWYKASILNVGRLIGTLMPGRQNAEGEHAGNSDHKTSQGQRRDSAFGPMFKRERVIPAYDQVNRIGNEGRGEQKDRFEESAPH
jgi:hypothetical protein